MGIMIKPAGDRLLVKLCRLDEKKVGNTVITLAHADKKRYQPECSKALVIAGGADVPAGVTEGVLVLIRSDAGVGLTSDVISAGDARLYRVIEYPEILAFLAEDALVSSANEITKGMEVVA